MQSSPEASSPPLSTIPLPNSLESSCEFRILVSYPHQQDQHRMLHRLFDRFVPFRSCSGSSCSWLARVVMARFSCPFMANVFLNFLDWLLSAYSQKTRTLVAL